MQSSKAPTTFSSEFEHIRMLIHFLGATMCEAKAFSNGNSRPYVQYNSIKYKAQNVYTNQEHTASTIFVIVSSVLLLSFSSVLYNINHASLYNVLSLFSVSLSLVSFSFVSTFGPLVCMCMCLLYILLCYPCIFMLVEFLVLVGWPMPHGM